jgi:pimeloyl-ACP methyl ester carboxylesterase
MVKTVHIRGIPHTYDITAPTGQPTVLVFVHGWLLSREYWQPVIEKLSPHYQCLCYDLRGFGQSRRSRYVSSSVETTVQTVVETQGSHGAIAASSPHQSYAPAAYADDLLTLLHHLQIERAWLVGHSLGGSISLWAADQSPSLVQGVICVNFGGGIYLKEEFERFRAAGQQLVRLRPRWLTYLPFVDLALTRMSVANPIPRAWGRQRLIDLVMADPEAALGALLDSTTEEEIHRLPQLVARLKQPAYFIAGEEDAVMEPKYVNHLASFHPLFEGCAQNVVEIPRCGHLAMVERPDTLAMYVREILKKHAV